MEKKLLLYLLAVVVVCLGITRLSKTVIVHAQSGPQTGNVAVQAIIPPHESDFQFAFVASAGSPVHQDQTIKYEITYGSRESAGINVSDTIVVHYAIDKAPDNSYAADYVIGSASDAYLGVHPVVDLINKTITWTIPDLPSGTVDQKVTFELKTNTSYQLHTNVPFVSTASMSNEYVTFPDLTVTLNYLYDPNAFPPAPTPTVHVTPGPSPTPDISLLKLYINDIAVTALSPNQATLQVSTNKSTRSKIKFGSSPAAMNETAQSADYGLTNTVTLNDLKPNTQYFFQVTVYDEFGHYYTADIMMLTTPTTPGLQLNQGDSAWMVTSGNTLLVSQILKANENGTSFIILPTNTTYLATFTPNIPPAATKSIELLITTNEGIVKRITMNQTASSYTAAVQTTQPGTYDMIIVQTDSEGNVISRKMSVLKVSPPLRIVDDASGDPIGDARVVLTFYNQQTKTYESLGGKQAPQSIFYTDKNGQGQILLSPGTYRVEVSAFGYDGKTVGFTLGPDAGQDYPTIALKKNVTNLTFVGNYLKDMTLDSITKGVELITQLRNSIRYYNIVSFTGLGSLTLLALLLFHIRTNIHFGSSLPFLLFHLSIMAKKHKEQYLYGTVVNKEGRGVANVRITVMALTDPTILTHTVSDATGNFHIRNTFEQVYVKLLVTKDGYPIVEMVVETAQKKAILIQFGKVHRATRTIRSILFGDLAGGFFEIVLLASLISELFFLESFGVMKTLPFVLLSLLNLILWIFYERKVY